VSDDPSGHLTIDLDLARGRLVHDGFLLTNERELGLPANFRATFICDYFKKGVIRHDLGDFPVDRERARDVIHYEWHEDGLELREYKKITLKNRAGIRGKREHSRVMLLGDAKADKLVRTVLNLVPLAVRQPYGTFGVNLFRTFTDVVTKPHHDDEQFVMLYVLDREGGGAESYLYRPEDVGEDGVPTAGPFFKHQLEPGEILIFDDKRFKHGATPLVALLGDAAKRDVLICTVDKRETYLRANVGGRVLDSVSHHPWCRYARRRLRSHLGNGVARGGRGTRVAEKITTRPS
jgi:hypothetical protein